MSTATARRLVIGAPDADGPGTRVFAGASCVLFSKASSLTAKVDLGAVAAGMTASPSMAPIAAIDPAGSVSSRRHGTATARGPDHRSRMAGDGPSNTSPQQASDSCGSSAMPTPLGPRSTSPRITTDGGQHRRPWRGSMHVASTAMSSASDVNSNGFDDLDHRSRPQQPPRRARATASDSYIMFGKAAGFGAKIDLAVIAAGTGGFVIHGAEADDRLRQLGVLRGRRQRRWLRRPHRRGVHADGRGHAGSAGHSYVMFGHADGFAAAIDLAAIAAGNGGFVIHGQDADDESGLSVSSAGDINGDGFDDLIIGASPPPGSGGHSRLRGIAMWCLAGPPASGLDRPRQARGPRRGFVVGGHDTNDRVRLVGGLRRRHQRRRL